MDSRRLQELRDVYARLSHQSTGATATATTSDGTSTAVATSSSSAVMGGGFDSRKVGACSTRSAALQQQNAKEASGGARSPRHAGSNDTNASNIDQRRAAGRVQTTAQGRNNTSQDRADGDETTTIATKSSNKTTSKKNSGVGITVSSAGSAGASVTQPPASVSFGSPKEEPLMEEHGSGSEYSGSRRRRGAGLRNTERRMRHELSGASSDHDGGGGGGVSGGGSADGGGAAKGAGGGGGSSAPKRRRKNKREGNSFYPRSYFDWDEDLMKQKLPERSWGPFAASIFELGLKHSSPKVLMKLMPPKADRLTTEHIKSRLQKYRLHAHRSKEEFLEFFNLRLKAKFADFVEREGWRNLSARHGDEEEDDSDDDGGGEDGGGGMGIWGGDGGGGAGPGAGTAGSDSEEPFVVNVDGRQVGDIRDLGAQCVREQANLQDMLRHHIAAQLKLQAEIHEHLTMSATAHQRTSLSTSSLGAQEDDDDTFGGRGPEASENNAGHDGQIRASSRGGASNNDGSSISAQGVDRAAAGDLQGLRSAQGVDRAGAGDLRGLRSAQGVDRAGAGDLRGLRSSSAAAQAASDGSGGCDGSGRERRSSP